MKASKKKSSAKGDKLEVIKILVLAVVSFVLGFALVFLFLRQDGPDDDSASEPSPSDHEFSAANPGSGYAPVAAQENHPPVESAASGGYAPEDPSPTAEQPDEGSAPPEVKPGKTPEGVLLDGDAFYLKCWDNDGVEHPGRECDKLPVLEKRLSTRLYVVDQCRREKAGESTDGKLSVAMEVDFQQMSISFWSGASSEIKNAAEIGACLRSKLSGLPVHSIEHKNARYRVFHTVLFGEPANKKVKQEAAKAAKLAASKGKQVDVIKDRVRVRQTPKDGEILGKISSGNQVRLLEQKAGWCHIITPKQTEGWMICDALDL